MGWLRSLRSLFGLSVPYAACDGKAALILSRFPMVSSFVGFRPFYAPACFAYTYVSCLKPRPLQLRRPALARAVRVLATLVRGRVTPCKLPPAQRKHSGLTATRPKKEFPPPVPPSGGCPAPPLADKRPNGFPPQKRIPPSRPPVGGRPRPAVGRQAA